MKKFYLIAGLWAALFSAKAQETATFDDVELQTETWYNGSDGAGGVSSGGFWFPIEYNEDWGSWSGFSVSNLKDSVTAGYGNQYSAITAGGVNKSENYAVVFTSGELQILLENPDEISGFYITNSTYTYLSMRDGDDFSKKFGGPDGSEADYLKLIITGVDIRGNHTEKTEFFLADFTAENSLDDYLVNSWKWVDLSQLGVVAKIHISMESSDVGDWGMNTPAYFCLDDFNGISPEMTEMVEAAGMENLDLENNSFYNGSDGAGFFKSGGFIFKNNYNSDWSSWIGFAASTISDNQTSGYENQYSAVPGMGAIGTSAYAVSYVSGFSEIEFEPSFLTGFYITNSTYAYLTIKIGDDFSKKFGGQNGDDPDWFKVTIAGISETGDTTAVKDHFLADFRFENAADDFIVDEWEWVDLSEFGKVSKLRFSLSSSDEGPWGMNTPAYFCLDQLNHQDLPPAIYKPLENVYSEQFINQIYYVDLDSVFTDPDNSDSAIQLKLEYIENSGMVTGTIVKSGKPGGTEKTMLALNLIPGMEGESTVYISGSSNAKKAWHSFKVFYSESVSAKFSEQTKYLKVFPNPVKDVFWAEVPESAQILFLADYSGRIVFRQSIQGQNRIEISALSGFPAGVYFLLIKTENGTLSKKIVKN